MNRKRSKWMLLTVAVATLLFSTAALAAGELDPNDDTLNTACPFVERKNVDLREDSRVEFCNSFPGGRPPGSQFVGTATSGKEYIYDVLRHPEGHTAELEAFEFEGGSRGTTIVSCGR